MKTAPRAASARASHFRKSSAAGLVLNFSPLEFEDKEIDAGVFAYGPDGDEVLKKLRKAHWATHVFRRDGPDEIVAITVKANARQLGAKSRKIRLKENLGLTASLIRNALINYLVGLPRPVLNYDPIRFIAQEDILPSCLPSGTDCPEWLGVRLLYDMAIRPIYFFKRDPLIAAVFDVRTTRILDRTAAELISEGFSPVGHYAAERVPRNEDPRILPHPELVGKVQGVNGSVLLLADSKDKRESVAANEVWLGRGAYKLDITPGAMKPTVDVYMRDDDLDTGQILPSPSGLPDPLVPAPATADWWMSPDIKVNHTPFYSPSGTVFDGVDFDTTLVHQDPHRGETNRFYLQVHNRGWQPTSNVSVRAFVADASAGLPALPNALTPPSFNLSSSANWTPVGPAQTIPLLVPSRPVIVTWDFALPISTATHTCCLAVVSSADDPFTNPATDIATLVTGDKRACLKNLHVIDPGPAPVGMTMVGIDFNNPGQRATIAEIIVRPTLFDRGTIALLLPKIDRAEIEGGLIGVKQVPLAANDPIGEWYERGKRSNEKKLVERWRGLDHSHIWVFNSVQVSQLGGIRLRAGETLRGVLVCSPEFFARRAEIHLRNHNRKRTLTSGQKSGEKVAIRSQSEGKESAKSEHGWPCSRFWRLVYSHQSGGLLRVRQEIAIVMKTHSRGAALKGRCVTKCFECGRLKVVHVQFRGFQKCMDDVEARLQ